MTTRAGSMLARMRDRWRAFRHGEHGGATAVLGFAVIAATIITGLSAFAMMNGSVTLSQRITQSAEVGVRMTIDRVLAEVNTGAASTQAKLNELVGREYPLDAAGNLGGRIRIDGAYTDGQSVRVELSVTSTGRIAWERTGTATLELAGAVALARVDEGRAVWDFTDPTGANSVVEQAVALWTPGEVTIHVPGIRIDDPTAPAPAIVRTSVGAGGAHFSAVYGGGCWDGESAYAEMLVTYVDASGRQLSAMKRTQSWAPGSSGRVQLGAAPALTEFISSGTGYQSATAEVRIRCEGGGRNSNWATASETVIAR